MDRIKIKKHLGLALSLFQPCDPVPVSPTGWSLPETGAWPTQSKGQGTDAERIRETGAKKKKKKSKKFTSSRAYAYLQGLLGDLYEINRISTQAKQLAYNGSSEYGFFFPLHSSLSPFSLIKICPPETDSFVA